MGTAVESGRSACKQLQTSHVCVAWVGVRTLSKLRFRGRGDFRRPIFYTRGSLPDARALKRRSESEHGLRFDRAEDVVAVLSDKFSGSGDACIANFNVAE